LRNRHQLKESRGRPDGPASFANPTNPSRYTKKKAALGGPPVGNVWLEWASHDHTLPIGNRAWVLGKLPMSLLADTKSGPAVL
jgi:hypothetical protein